MSTDLVPATLDEERRATRFFDTAWRPIIEQQPPAVRAHLLAERRFVEALLQQLPYRTVVEAGCADGSLLLPVIRAAGPAYLGIDLAPDAVAATRAAGGDAICADIRDLATVAPTDLPPPVLVAFPFNVLGNIPAPRDAVAAVGTRHADLLILTYDTSPAACRVRAGYYRAAGFDGTFHDDADGQHFTAGLFTSSVYRPEVLTGWLVAAGYFVAVRPYGVVGLAYHATR